MIEVDQTADIVMLGTFSAWNLGTIQARALPFAQALASHGLRTTIVTTPWDAPNEAGTIDVRNRVTIINTDSVSTRLPFIAARQQAAWVHRLQPAGVHVLKPKGFGALTARLIPADIPIVVDSDDWEGDGGWNDVAGYSWAQQRVFHVQELDLIRRCSAVTAASTLLQQRALQLRSDRMDGNVALIENGLSHQRAKELHQARTRPPSNISPPVIVLYSRFEEFPSSWLNEFCHALAEAVTEHVVVRVIGRDRIDNDPLAVVGSIELDILGYVASSAIPDLLGTATIAVYPYADSLITRSKQSVKLLELMAAGCPVIASDIGDVARTLAGAGRLQGGSNPVVFARCVAEELEKPESLDRMSEEATSHVTSTYNFDSLGLRLLDVYASVGLDVKETVPS